jgi:transcriptional regulator with XRE-family HTH domain
MPQERSKRDLVPGFAAALRAERERQGLSATELARRAGTAVATVSKLELERRAPSFRLVLALAGALGVTTDSLAPGIRAAKKRPKKDSEKLVE